MFNYLCRFEPNFLWFGRQNIVPRQFYCRFWCTDVHQPIFPAADVSRLNAEQSYTETSCNQRLKNSK